MKKVLIACHGFPPNPGIGGRRWAKFAKYLAQKDVEVHVICSENISDDVSFWQEDAASEKIHRHYLPYNYPHILMSESDRLVDKLTYRLTSFWYNAIQKYRIYDRTFLWEKQFTEKVKQLRAEHQIDNLIVTGAPFYWMHHAAGMKAADPSIRLFLDFRDHWIGSVNYGIAQLAGEALKFEQKIWKDVFTWSDYAFSPNPIMPGEMKEALWFETKTQFLELSHAYDPDDLAAHQAIPAEKNPNELRFVYGGTLYNRGSKQSLIELKQALDKLEAESPVLYEKIRFDFYTPEQHFAALFKSHQDKVRFMPSVGTEIFNKIKSADFCLLFLSDHNKDYQTTKFVEFLTLRKPFVLIGPRGYVGDFIEKNNLGRCLEQGQIVDGVINLAKGADAVVSEYNATFDNSKYSLDKVTDTLIGMLK